MRSHSCRIVGLALISVAIALGRAPTAAAQTVVACGTSSSFDGEQMILTGDLSCAGTAVTITHNNVHLDMQGFTIDGDGTGIGIHLINAFNPTGAPCVGRSGPSGVHINGGTVKDFEHGIFMCRSDTAHINGMTVTSNVRSGIKISRASTGGHSGPSNHRINGCTLSFNGSTANFEGGLVVEHAHGNVIHTMDIFENTSGVYLFGVRDTRITSSEIIDNVSAGVFLDRSGNDTVQSCNIQGNRRGISAFLGFDHTIRGNTVNNNTNIGISLNGPRNCVVRGNTVNNNLSGIFVFRSISRDNLLQSNTALGNVQFDLGDTNTAAAPLPCNNTWKNNTFVTTRDPGGCIQ